MKLALSALVLAASIAAPALAGPAGSGLALTEDVARRVQQQRIVQIAGLGDCAERAAVAVRGHEGVAKSAHRAGDVTVTFHSADHAARHEGAVRAAATGACAA
jgi:hypothetical protein